MSEPIRTIRTIPTAAEVIAEAKRRRTPAEAVRVIAAIGGCVSIAADNAMTFERKDAKLDFYLPAVEPILAEYWTDVENYLRAEESRKEGGEK